MSQSIAALWPTFTVSNQQQFIHYNAPSTGLSFTSFGTPVGGGSATGGVTTVTEGQRNYQSQSNVNMSYTLFNGGQNWNNVGASARAIAVVQYLISKGVDPHYLAAAGFGEFQPIDNGTDDEALARNRRIELKLTER